jgi:hypothetical protein
MRLLRFVDNGMAPFSLQHRLRYGSTGQPRRRYRPTPNDYVNQMLLAVERQVGMRDSQLSTAASGLAVSDRNAELLLAAPFELPGVAERRVSRRALLGLR